MRCQHNCFRGEFQEREISEVKFSSLKYPGRHSTKQGLDLWTRGPVDPAWFRGLILFRSSPKCKKGTGYEFRILLQCAMVRCTKKRDLIYSVISVFFDIYSLPLTKGIGVSVVDIYLMIQLFTATMK